MGAALRVIGLSTDLLGVGVEVLRHRGVQVSEVLHDRIGAIGEHQQSLHPGQLGAQQCCCLRLGHVREPREV